MTEKREAEATDELFGLAYDELRGLADAYIRRERPGHTLQATELVNEAYLRLTSGRAPLAVSGREHFLAVAARAMRNVLVDHARARGRKKRAGGLRRVTLAEGLAGSADVDLDTLLGLDEALERLAGHDARQARVVELRFFSGLDMAEIAAEVGVSKRTVEGDWAHARAWLHRALSTGV